MQEPNMPLPHPAFKGALLKAFREFELFGGRVPRLLAWPCSKPFSVPDSNVLVLFGLTGHWVHALALW